VGFCSMGSSVVGSVISECSVRYTSMNIWVLIVDSLCHCLPLSSSYSNLSAMILNPSVAPLSLRINVTR
jgi:hypothetical protein